MMNKDYENFLERMNSSNMEFEMEEVPVEDSEYEDDENED